VKPSRGGVDSIGVLPQEDGQIFELRLDPFTALQVRLKSRVKCRKLRHSAPHSPEG
jgi:hypothetical protein